MRAPSRPIRVRGTTTRVAIANLGARRIIISALFFCLASCAAAPQHPVPELTAHLHDSENNAEHDEIRVAGGLVVEEYPSRKNPRRIYYRFPQGGIMDLTCQAIDSDPCSEWSMRITGFRSDHMPAPFLNIRLPEGIYLLLLTDNPHISVIKNADTEQTVGYWVTNKDVIWIVGSYKQALAMEDGANQR